MEPSQQPLAPTPPQVFGSAGSAPQAPASANTPNKNILQNAQAGFQKYKSTNLVLSLVLVALFIAMQFALDMFLVQQATNEDVESSQVLLTPLLVIGLVLLSVYLFLALSKLLLEGVRGKKLSLGATLPTLNNLLCVAVYIVALAAIIFGLFWIFLAGILQSALIFLLLIPAIPLLIYLSVRWSFLPLVIVDKGLGPFKSLGAADKMSSGYRGTIFAWTIFFGIISGAASFVLSMSSGVLSLLNSDTLEAVMGLGSIVIAMAFSLANYLGIAELYRQINDGSREAATNPVAPVAPSAPLPPSQTTI